MENRRRIAFLVGPPAIYLLIIFLLPLGVMVLFSFREATIGAAREVLTLKHYQAYLANAFYHRLLWRSALIALVIACCSVLLAYPLAYFLVFKAGARRILLLTLLIMPTWTSYLLRIFAWKLILGSNGILNTLLLSLGIIDTASPILLYSRNAVMATLVYVWFPFVALPIFASLERIDRSLLEAAADLGCRPWQAFLRVTLPLSMPGIVAGFFFCLIPTLGEFVTPLLVGGAQGAMYGNLIQDQFMRALNWSMGSVMSLAMLALTMLFIFLFTRVGSLTRLVEP